MLDVVRRTILMCYWLGTPGCRMTRLAHVLCCALVSFQPVVPEVVARSLKAAGFLGVAPGSWDFRRMKSCAIKSIYRAANS